MSIDPHPAAAPNAGAASSRSSEGGAGARYVMVGGFLGAGKTTAVARLARHLHEQGRRVGLITNDQGSQLVDSALLSAKGFPVEEIAGGCFCCRFNSLAQAAKKLTATTRPEVIIAEPVGSCTDLVATVSYPLRRIYGSEFSIAPLSVLVDPVRAARVLGLQSGGRFSEKVLYIYRKQLEEADWIVVNKTDLINPEARERLVEALRVGFPRARILCVSARTGAGLEGWFDQILSQELVPRPIMDVDYALYGAGEALLGWLNATVRVRHDRPQDGNALLRHLARVIQQGLAGRQAEIAHLKMNLEPDTGLPELASLNLVRNDFIPELSQELEQPLDQGHVVINLRAEASPEILREALQCAVDSLAGPGGGWSAQVEHAEVFQPGQPQPTYREDGVDPH